MTGWYRLGLAHAARASKPRVSDSSKRDAEPTVVVSFAGRRIGRRASQWFAQSSAFDSHVSVRHRAMEALGALRGALVCSCAL
jgi:hypothetical protein